MAAKPKGGKTKCEVQDSKRGSVGGVEVGVGSVLGVEETVTRLTIITFPFYS